MRLGVYVFGLAAAAMGVVDLVYGALDPAHQPLQAWGDNIPGSQIVAYVLGVLLVTGGTAVLFRRTARLGAGLVGAVYVATAIFWLPRLYTAPRVLGGSAAVYIGVLGGVFQELVVVAAAILIADEVSEQRSARTGIAAQAARVIFALGAIDFGLVHLTGIQANTPYVPEWMPLGQPFWVGFTGVAFVLAGIAILTGLLDVIASRLLALMWLVFSAVTLLPGLAASPHAESHWGGNVYNILVAACAWIVGAWLAAHKAPALVREET